MSIDVDVQLRGEQQAHPSTPRGGGRFGVAAGHEHYKWWALSCTSLGMLLAATNSGTLIIALPDLERSLHTSLLALVWVILAYLIAATVLVLMAGRLSDLFGRKRAYVGGFVLFALASLGAGFSPDATVLILWRVLQGIGSAFLFANAAALVTDAFPKRGARPRDGRQHDGRRGRPGARPGARRRARRISWHWVFWFNVPFALAGALWGALILRELAKPDTRPRLRRARHATFVIGLTGLVLGVSRGGLTGWNDAIVIGGLAAAAVLLPPWVLIERRSRAPMLDLDDLPQPPVRRRQRRRVHQRPGSLRADVPVRLLLPGRPGRLADHRRHQADPAGARNAGRLPPGRHLCRPPRLAHAGRDRHARQRRRPRGDDDAAGPHRLLAERALAGCSWGSARGCSTAPTPPR